ncbi:MAG: 50S ribosomal protein L3 N(5)-glutamine methyltransferase [Pseudomonadota bacterium]
MSNLASALVGAPSVGDAVGAIARFFDEAELWYGHGTANADDEAAWLVAAVHEIDYADADWAAAFARVLEAPLQPAARAALSELAEARVATRKPLAYLLGEAWFAGCRYYVNEHTLVPRSPIAGLIQEAYRPWVEPESVGTVLEIGTGSGCIAIATALTLPAARVDATDISAPALAVAARNVERHQVGGRVHLYEADLYPPHAERYDLIVSNPPYVDAAEMAARPAEYRHEPELGLAAGPDGLAIVRRMLAGALDRLTDAGLLVLEVGASDEALQRTYAEVPFTWLMLDDDATGVAVIERKVLAEHAGRLQELGSD